jgi:hypothetical protein
MANRLRRIVLILPLGSVGVFISDGPLAGFGVNPSARVSSPYHHPVGFRSFPLLLDDDGYERRESGCYYANPNS